MSSVTAGDWIHVPGAGATPSPERVGGKAHQLERLQSIAGAEFSVPRFVVVPAEVFDSHAEDPALPAGFEEALASTLASSGLDRATLAVRSSAVGEDGATRSFAGQFDTVLGVRGSDLAAVRDAIRAVWASASSARAAAYGASEGAPSRVRMAVVIQELVDPRASGVAFSADPVSGARDVAVVSAVHGLGEGLVSGELDADTYRVRFTGGSPVVESTLARKTHAVRLAPGGRTRLEPVPERDVSAPALAEHEAIAVARAARALETRFGAPQDVEWAFPREGGELVLLQARPITTLGEAPARPAGPRWVWDNSNIIESYSGVTTPLTFTFAREVYERVYLQFCRLMGVPDAVLASHRPVFAHLLALVRGRVYYDLLNWYRTLALLPGFQWNRSYMERMMGVREALVDAPPPPSAGSRLRDLASLVRMIVRMIREAGRLQREVPAFRARVERALAPLRRDDPSHWPPAEALALYHRLERELLDEWKPPLVNDFFAMIFFGVLSRLVERWLPQAPATLVNDLLCGEGGIVSTEPARRVMALARRVRESPELAAAFAAESDDRALQRRLEGMPGAAELEGEIRRYLEDFGDRCMEELKLETVTLGEDPAFLIAMIRAYASQGTIDPEAAWARERAIRAAAEATVDAALTPWKRPLFRWVLVRARRRVRDRENLRFERTRVFGVVRRIVLALGRGLAAERRLPEPRDVFFLTRAELFAAAGGETREDLAAIARERRARFEAWAREPAPPDRFETFVPPGDWGPEWAPREPTAPAAATIAELRGTGCCPGVVQAPVRVVSDPRNARDLEGSILVAERTDPGWTLLFPAVRGLLVQRGSLLSHSAIVAREMGLPCVVGIAGLLDALRDGERVEMDGTTGMVRRLDPVPGS